MGRSGIKLEKPNAAQAGQCCLIRYGRIFPALAERQRQAQPFMPTPLPAAVPTAPVPMKAGRECSRPGGLCQGQPPANRSPDQSPDQTSPAVPESDNGSESEEKTYDSDMYGPVTYDSVTIHYRAEDEEPLTVERVIRFADSFFPGSGERALQVIDDPRKGPVGGLFDVDLILIPPKEISHLVLRKGEEETTATVEEALSGNAPDFSTPDAP